VTEDDWKKLSTLQHDVPDRVALAMGYAWGRQDAIGEQYTQAAIRFSLAYAQRWHDYQHERQHYVPNIQTAYDRWLETGDIV
jgi:hypothetical protein